MAVADRTRTAEVVDVVVAAAGSAVLAASGPPGSSAGPAAAEGAGTAASAPCQVERRRCTACLQGMADEAAAFAVDAAVEHDELEEDRRASGLLSVHR